MPGAPRSIIPGLARAGIEVLSIGVNSYAPRPQIPTPAMWKEPSTGDSVMLIMTEQVRLFSSFTAIRYCITARAVQLDPWLFHHP